MTRSGDLLQGVRVLDLTRLLPGPLCTQHLADLGAEVIKVEDVHGGDYARFGLGIGSGEEITYFDLVNRGKASVAIDLKQPQGRLLFLELAETAHIVVESFRPGVVDRLGIGHEAATERNPAIVYCAITGYGQTGPLAQQAGHDLNYCALAGVIDQTGSANGAPAIPAYQIADLAGGTLTASTAILAALHKAQRTGEGSYLDIAMADSVLAHSVFNLASYRGMESLPPRGGGMLTGGMPCYRVYETADSRHLAVAALEKKFWERLCLAIDRADLVDKQAAVGGEGSTVHRDLERLFRSKTLAEWMRELDPADCCVNPVYRFDEVLRHPQFEARGLVSRSGSAESGTDGFAFPARVNGESIASDKAAPAYGADGLQVLRALGYHDAEINGLLEQGVVRVK